MLIQQCVISHKKQRLKPLFISSVLISLLTLSACQTAPTLHQSSPTAQMPVVINDHNEDDVTMYDPNANYDYSINPEDIPEIEPSRFPDIIITPEPPVLTPPSTIITIPSPEEPPIVRQPAPLPPLSHNELLERARQHSTGQNRQPSTNTNELPAFRSLMTTGIAQLKAGQLSAAESSFTRAQRIAPKSSAVYFYLAQVALKKNQPRKAEAMARRGLSVSQDASRRRALWQIILRAGQLQNSTRVIQEAQQALR